MQAVLYIFISVLCLIGLATLIRGIVYSIFKSNWSTKLYHIILLDNDNPEIIIRDAVEQINWNNFSGSRGLYALNCGLNEENIKAVNLILKDYNIPLYTAETLGKALYKSNGTKY